MTKASAFALATAAYALALAVGVAAAPTASEIYFQTPTRNIQCAMIQPASPEFAKVECIVWSTRNRAGEPKQWEVDFWRTTQVYRTNQGVVGGPVLTLRYGRALRRGYFRCVSRRAGLTCLSLHSRHGFRLSRERQVIF